jgi:hypothetical protein
MVLNTEALTAQKPGSVTSFCEDWCNNSDAMVDVRLAAGLLTKDGVSACR